MKRRFAFAFTCWLSAITSTIIIIIITITIAITTAATCAASAAAPSDVAEVAEPVCQQR